MNAFINILGGLMTTTVCYVIHDYILPQYCRPKSLPKQKYNSFDNIAVSLVHSTVTGIGAIIAIRSNPSIIEDMIFNYDDFSMFVTRISFGYFLYDLLDMLRMNGWNPIKMKEMTVHHLCCITCFGIAITTGQYLGLAMLVLNMEINSIFLHGRSLLQYCQFRGTSYFAVASFLNVLTNITHRQLIGMQVLKWFYQLTLTSEEKLVWVGFTSGIIIFALNVKLLITCIKSDYLRKRTENKF